MTRELIQNVEFHELERSQEGKSPDSFDVKIVTDNFMINRNPIITWSQ